MGDRGAIDFEVKVQFPANAFDAARMYLALMAYPEEGEGTRGQRGGRLTEALGEYYIWGWRQARGLREVRSKLAAPCFNTPRPRHFKGAVDRGRRRVMRRFAAYGIVGNQMINAMLQSNEIARLMKERGRDPFVRNSKGGYSLLRSDIWDEAMPSVRHVIRSDLPRWSERFDLKETVVSADPRQKERDLVARGFMQSRPVVHMAHGINEALANHEKDFSALGEADWMLVLLWNCEIWVWEAIEQAERWRMLCHWNRLPMLAPELMIELVSPKMCGKLPSANKEGGQP